MTADPGGNGAPSILTAQLAAHAAKAAPHGPAPAFSGDLPTVEAVAGLAGRIVALAANGCAVEEESPQTAAACWHEAGRLLAGRAGSPAEAWLCHSRALAVHPEFNPARRALRRLTMMAGDAERSIGVIDAEIDHTADEAEIAALLAERAAAELALGRTGAALGTLRDAARSDPGALVPRLLLLARGGCDIDDAELVETLETVVGGWPGGPDGKGDPGLRLMLALIEERIGAHDAAAARIVAADAGADDSPHRPSAWTAARLALRAGRTREGAEALAAIAGSPDSGAVAEAAFGRFASMVLALEADAEEAATWIPGDSSGAAAEPAMVVALRAGEPERERRVLQSMEREVSTPGFKEALRAAAAATRLASGGPPIEDPASLGAAGRILERLLSPDAGDPDRPAPAADRPENDIHGALRDGDASRVAAAIDALQDLGGDEDERWILAVAGAWLRAEHLDNPEEAVRGLRAATDLMVRDPLPRLIRARISDRASLAELAALEADHAPDPGAAALKLAHAAQHLALIDPARSAELHRRALEIDPACAVSLRALARGDVDHEALAEAHAAAAAAADDDDGRFHHLLRAGVHELALGDCERSRQSLRRALELRPGEVDLWVAVLRLTRDLPPDDSRDVPPPPEGGAGLPARLLTALGGLSFDRDPAMGIDAFAGALEDDPDDPVARHGHDEALLAAGRGTIVSARLLERMNRTEDARERAGLLLRLADIDSRYGGDRTSAVLSLLSLTEIMPGHRPTLIELMVHFARQGRRDDLSRVLAAAARTLEDDGDASALAQIAWQGTAADLDLLRLAVARGADTAVHLALLEALTDSPAERLELLGRIAAAPGMESLGVLARMAEAREEAGDGSGAVEILGRLAERDPGDIVALSGLRRLRREAGDAAGEAEALAAMARASGVAAHRLEYLLAEARLAHRELADPARAAACCEAALEIDPSSEQAYRAGRTIFEELGDVAGVARMVTRRIDGTDDGRARRDLLLDLAGLRESAGEAALAKEALGRALELAPDDVPTRRRIAALHIADREWDEAIGHLMEAARANRDPGEGQQIFFELGVLYADHTERADLAEKSFVKVLGWNRGHFAAMERLAEVYLRVGNWQRAAQALERLTLMSDDPAVKSGKLVALAAVLDTRLERPADAERLLNEARSIDPLGLEPIRGLAELYTRQRDAMALNVLLDQALVSHGAALQADPDRAPLYANLYRILEMKAEDEMASLAVGVLDLLGARGDWPDIPPDVVEVHWQGGARAADPSLAEFFCPPAIQPGLRETLRAVEEPIARALGAAARQVNLPRDTRIDRKHPLAMMLSLLTPAFGVRGEIICHVTAGPGIRFAPGSPGIALVPETVAAAEDPAVVAFAAGSILAQAREGLSLSSIVPEERLRRLVAGVVKLAVPGFAPREIDPAALAEELDFLRRSVPEKVLARVAPFAFESGGSLEHPGLGAGLGTIAHRVGMMTSGSLTGALRALGVEHGRPATPLSLLPGAGSMIAFAFSKDHAELRRRMGV